MFHVSEIKTVSLAWWVHVGFDKMAVRIAVDLSMFIFELLPYADSGEVLHIAAIQDWSEIDQPGGSSFNSSKIMPQIKNTGNATKFILSMNLASISTLFKKMHGSGRFVSFVKSCQWPSFR